MFAFVEFRPADGDDGFSVVEWPRPVWPAARGRPAGYTEWGAPEAPTAASLGAPSMPPRSGSAPRPPPPIFMSVEERSPRGNRYLGHAWLRRLGSSHSAWRGVDLRLEGRLLGKKRWTFGTSRRALVSSASSSTIAASFSSIFGSSILIFFSDSARRAAGPPVRARRRLGRRLVDVDLLLPAVVVRVDDLQIFAHRARMKRRVATWRRKQLAARRVHQTGRARPAAARRGSRSSGSAPGIAKRRGPNHFHGSST